MAAQIGYFLLGVAGVLFLVFSLGVLLPDSDLEEDEDYIDFDNEQRNIY